MNPDRRPRDARHPIETVPVHHRQESTMIGFEELLQIFNHFDGDHNGRIDRGEFKRLMVALGANAPDEELDIGFIHFE